LFVYTLMSRAGRAMGHPDTVTPGNYDAVLVLSFGGPEKEADVWPFLERVTRGRNVPRARLEEVAASYLQFGGRSPINRQCRELIAALRAELDAHGIGLPIYWGNRNWHPFIEDTMREMAAAGVRRALVFVTSAYSSYSGCRQYLEDLDRARAAAGEDAPECEKLRQYCLHPGFLGPMAENVRAALDRIPEPRRGSAELLFTAHSIPLPMAATSRYVEQLTEASALAAAAAGHPEHRVVYQSRSGPPSQPWLEPDIKDALAGIARTGRTRDAVVAPIGFVSDHMEVLVDLDTQARGHAGSLGLNFVRAATVGTHPRFIAMIRELIEERLHGRRPPAICQENCCANPYHRGRPAHPGGAGSPSPNER
jgi:ferrochelatase